jgi:hypothetical protein
MGIKYQLICLHFFSSNEKRAHTQSQKKFVYPFSGTRKLMIWHPQNPFSGVDVLFHHASVSKQRCYKAQCATSPFAKIIK